MYSEFPSGSFFAMGGAWTLTSNIGTSVEASTATVTFQLPVNSLVAGIFVQTNVGFLTLQSGFVNFGTCGEGCTGVQDDVVCSDYDTDFGVNTGSEVVVTVDGLTDSNCDAVSVSPVRARCSCVVHLTLGSFCVVFNTSELIHTAMPFRNHFCACDGV